MISKTLRLAALLAALSLALPLAQAGGMGGGGMGGGGMGGGGMGGGGMGGGGMGGGGMGGGGMGGGGMGGGGMGGGGMGGGGMGGGGMGGGGMGGGGMGGGGMGGNFTRLSTIDMIKQQLAIPDDEWTVIQPKLQKVLDAQTALRNTTTNAFGGGGGGGGRGGRGGRGGMDTVDMAGATTATAPATQTNPVQTAQTQLASALQDAATKADVVAAKLKALRDARSKAKDTLTLAQDDLKKVLSIRQEAALVNLGYLE